MLVRDRQSADGRVSRVRAGLWRKAWERVCILVANRFSMRGLWKLSLANTGVDITERHEIGACGIDGHRITFPLAPFAMATVKIR